MFPATRTNGHLQQSKQEHREGQDPTPIQKIVREETGDGRLIVRFLVSTMQGGLEGSKPCHRLNAARQLLDLGFTEAQAFIEDNTQHPNRRRRSPNDNPRRVLYELCKIVREETDDGRDAVRFLVDVMQGSLEGFKAHHRLAAAKELLHRGFDDTEPDDPDPEQDDEQPVNGRPTSGYRLRTPVNPYGPRVYLRDTEDGSHDPADDDDSGSGDSNDDHSRYDDSYDPDGPYGDSYDPYNERPTQAVAAEPTGDGSRGGDTAIVEHASPEAGEPPTGGPDVDDDPGCSDPEDPGSNSCDPNAGFPVPRDQYYDFADPPYYGKEPEEEPKPDPNALSKWELKAMEKGTLVWDSPGHPYIDSTTPGRP